jgi:Putative adhesin
MLRKIFALLFIFSVGLSHASEVYYQEVRKTATVNADFLFNLDINFADVNIQTWDKNQVDVVVKIDVSASSEKRANELINGIIVNFSGESAQVNLSVTLGNSSCNNKGSESTKVIVEIKMPPGGTLDGKCSFGDFAVTSLNGPCKMTVEYGEFKATNLNSKDNDLKVQFGGCTIQNTNGGDFRIEYGDMDVKKLNGNGDFDAAFGDLEIDLVTNAVKRLDIDMEYGDAEISLARDASFTFSAKSDYGDVDLPDNSKKTSVEKDYTSKNVKGTIGSGGSATLNIKCSFGDVEIDMDVN